MSKEHITTPQFEITSARVNVRSDEHVIGKVLWGIGVDFPDKPVSGAPDAKLFDKVSITGRLEHPDAFRCPVVATLLNW